MRQHATDGSTFSEGGFTLIEMLLVMVILPLVVGAIVDVIITAVQNDSVVSGRLWDTQAAQVLTSYFGRDVESATGVSTDPSRACGTPGQSLADGDTLSGGVPELTLNTGTSWVSYWLVPSGEPDGQGAVVRTSCASVPGPTSDAVAASLGTAESPAFLYVDIIGPGSAEVESQVVDAASIQSVSISAGHSANDVQQSPGSQIDLVEAPRV